jgi:predicted enzyme related to lactoylglutathione lyase
MDIQTVTITVSNLKKSKDFYEGMLGFVPGPYYEPTNWQAYVFNGKLFGIREKQGYLRAESFDITNFEVDNVEEIWSKVQAKVKVIEKLATTSWGSYRFVIADPDGYQIAFVARTNQT